MSLERRIERLEGQGGKPLDHCPVCDPGANVIAITYAVDDPDPRTPPGEQETPELQECQECGRRYRVFGRAER